MTAEQVLPMDPPETCIRVLTSSMGCVKFTAKHAAEPPQAMDSMSVGLRVAGSDMARRDEDWAKSSECVVVVNLSPWGYVTPPRLRTVSIGNDCGHAASPSAKHRGQDDPTPPSRRHDHPVLTCRRLIGHRAPPSPAWRISHPRCICRVEAVALLVRHGLRHLPPSVPLAVAASARCLERRHGECTAGLQGGRRPTIDSLHCGSLSSRLSKETTACRRRHVHLVWGGRCRSESRDRYHGRRKAEFVAACLSNATGGSDLRGV